MRPLPVIPSLGIDDPAILEGHQELSRLVLDVDQGIDQELDLAVDVGRLDPMKFGRHLDSDKRKNKPKS